MCIRYKLIQIVFLLSIAIMCSGAHAFPLNDGFESGDVNQHGWIETGAHGWTVTKENPKVGSHSIEYNNQGLDTYLAATTTTGVGLYQAWTYSTNTSKPQPLRYGLYTSAAGNIALIENNLGTISAIGAGTTNFALTLDANKWYRWVIEAGPTDFNAHIYSATGTLLESEVNQAYGGGGIANLSLIRVHEFGGAHISYVDEVTYAQGISTVKLFEPTGSFSTNTVDINFQVLGNCANYDYNIIDTNSDGAFILQTGTDANANYTTFSLDLHPVQESQYIRVDVNCDTNSLNTAYDLSLIDLNLYDYNSAYSNYVDYNGLKYVNTLNYDINYRCGVTTGSPDINTIVQAASVANFPLTCDNTNRNILNTYIYTPTGEFDINFSLTAVDSNDNNIFGDNNFFSDTNAPIIRDYNIISNEGFELDANAFLWCQDLNSPLQYFTITLNDVNILDENSSDNNVLRADANLVSGDNNLSVQCRDLVGNTANASRRYVFYTKHFFIINEETGAPFNLNDVNGLIMISYDTNYQYDFKTKGKTDVWFVSGIDDNFTFIFTYGTDQEIKRNFNTNLISELTDINICGTQYQTFYEQIVLSGKKKGAAILSNYTNCYIMADYTKFAYSDSLINMGYTIDLPYTLYTWDRGTRVILSLIDGETASVINLDVLEYKQTLVPATFTKDYLSIYKDPDFNSTLEIRYKNIRNENDEITLAVYDGSTEIFSHHETASPNDLLVYFDYTTITIDNNVLKVIVTATRNDGDVEEIKQYFTLFGQSGVLPAELAALLAIFFFIMGFTIVSARLAMGWFGILMGVVSFAILTFAVPTWYTTLLQGIILIVMLAMIIIFKEETARLS